jgi:hypothetical protein
MSIRSKLTLLSACAAALSLGACSATASGGGADLAPLIQVSQPGDAQMSCEQLTTEIAAMDAAIAEQRQAAVDAERSGQVAATGAGVATNAALYSGALGRVPGLGLAANAAAGQAQARAQAEAERREENARNAEMRRTSLMGIYQGRGC